MSRLAIELPDYEERETARLVQVADRGHEASELVEHPDDAGFRVACALVPAEPPFAERVEWIEIGRSN